MNRFEGVFICSETSGTLASALQTKVEFATTSPDVHSAGGFALGVDGVGRSGARGSASGQGWKKPRGALVLVKQWSDSWDAISRAGDAGVSASRRSHRGCRDAAGLGTDLRPLLTMIDGRIESLENARSPRKSLGRVLEIIQRRWPGRQPTEIGIAQAEAGDDLTRLPELL